MPSIFSHDPVQAAASLDALATLDADVLLPGHGHPLNITPADAVDEAKKRLSDAGWWDR
jgi:hypothetical protein